MDSQTHLDAVQREGARLIDVAATALDAPVTCCPDWTVADLVAHVGQVYGFIGGALAGVGSTERPTVAPVEVPAADGRIEWLRRLHGELVVALQATDPTAPAWNWAGTGEAGFFHRRMAHESLVHRWDVEDAAGAVTAIDSDLGADGVDELVHVGMQHSMNPQKVFSYPAGSLHLHRTDGDGEWLLRTDEGRLVVTREHAKGDAAVRGTGDNLLLFMWGRGGEGLEIFGDQAVADAWSHASP